MSRNWKNSFLKLKKPRYFFPLFFAVLLIWSWVFCLPNPLFHDSFATIILSEEGKVLSAKIAKDEQWRFPPINRVPEKYKKALILFEDKRFYKHSGVDVLALARSAYLNYKRGKIVSGGSWPRMRG